MYTSPVVFTVAFWRQLDCLFNAIGD